jgi:hypothetical protein
MCEKQGETFENIRKYSTIPLIRLRQGYAGQARRGGFTVLAAGALFDLTD